MRDGSFVAMLSLFSGEKAGEVSVSLPGDGGLVQLRAKRVVSSRILAWKTRSASPHPHNNHHHHHTNAIITILVITIIIITIIIIIIITIAIISSSSLIVIVIVVIIIIAIIITITSTARSVEIFASCPREWQEAMSSRGVYLSVCHRRHPDVVYSSIVVGGTSAFFRVMILRSFSAHIFCTHFPQDDFLRSFFSI